MSIALVTGGNGWLVGHLLKQNGVGLSFTSQFKEVHITTRRHDVPAVLKNHYQKSMADESPAKPPEEAESCAGNIHLHTGIDLGDPGCDKLRDVLADLKSRISKMEKSSGLTVVHVAANSMPSLCEALPWKELYPQNCPTAFLQMLEEAQFQALHFLFTSTDMVYDGTPPPDRRVPNHFSEGDTQRVVVNGKIGEQVELRLPTNCYGCSKLKFEHELQVFAQRNRFVITIFRLSNMMDTEGKFLKFLIDSCRTRKEIPLLSDSYRNFVAVGDVCKSIDGCVSAIRKDYIEVSSARRERFFSKSKTDRDAYADSREHFWRERFDTMCKRINSSDYPTDNRNGNDGGAGQGAGGQDCKLENKESSLQMWHKILKGSSANGGDAPNYRIYNIGGRQAMTRVDLAQIVARKMGVPTRIKFTLEEEKVTPGEPVSGVDLNQPWVLLPTKTKDLESQMGYPVPLDLGMDCGRFHGDHPNCTYLSMEDFLKL